MVHVDSFDVDETFDNHQNLNVFFSLFNFPY